MKYIDADLLRKEIKFAKSVYENPKRVVLGVADAYRQDGRAAMCDDILKKIDSLQQEQPDDLASLISEATNVAKRIVDRDSFYNSLPQNLRNKYTSKAWCEILGALSTMKWKEQPEVDLEKFTEKMDSWKTRFNRPDDIPIKATMAFTARMFYMYPKVAREWYESLPKATQD